MTDNHRTATTGENSNASERLDYCLSKFVEEEYRKRLIERKKQEEEKKKKEDEQREKELLNDS